MKIILKPYSEDITGHDLSCNIYEVYQEKQKTVIIVNKTMSGLKLHEVDKNRILKVID